jgi:hypothetical protein
MRLTGGGTTRTMIHMFDTFRAVIDAWPSLAAFARDIGTSENTAKGMRRRDSIPPEYWTDAVKGAASRDIDSVTLEMLAALAKARGQVAA